MTLSASRRAPGRFVHGMSSGCGATCTTAGGCAMPRTAGQTARGEGRCDRLRWRSSASRRQRTAGSGGGRPRAVAATCGHTLALRRLVAASANSTPSYLCVVRFSYPDHENRLCAILWPWVASESPSAAGTPHRPSTAVERQAWRMPAGFHSHWPPRTSSMACSVVRLPVRFTAPRR